MFDRSQRGWGRLEQEEAERDHPAVGSLTFEPETGAYVADIDEWNGSPSTTVASVVAEITGQSVTDLRPLQRAVDPDALDRILEHRPSNQSRNERTVEFAYEDFEVRVSSRRVIEVALPHEGSTDR